MESEVVVEVVGMVFSDSVTSENAGNSARLVEPDMGVSANAVTSLALEGDDKFSKHLSTPEARDAASANKTDAVLHPDPDSICREENAYS